MTEQGVGVVRPLPGDGLIAHMGGLLLVCDAADAVADDLVAAVRETAAAGGDGRALARRAAQVLARTMTAEPIACAVAGRTGGGIAVLVSGDAQASITGPGTDVHLDGKNALTWTDRLVTTPVTSVELRLPGAGRPLRQSRLDSGVIPGGGVVSDLGEDAGAQAGGPSRSPAESSRPAPPAEPSHAAPAGAGPSPVVSEPAPSSYEPSFEPAPSSYEPSFGSAAPSYEPSFGGEPSGPPFGQGHGPAEGPPPVTPPPPVNVPPPPSDLSGPPLREYEQPPALLTDPEMPHAGRGGHGPGEQEFDPFLLHPEPPGEHAGAPGSMLEPTEMGPTPEPPSRPMVYGVDCQNDHFNDPRVPYCAVCGVALVQRNLVPYKGERPPLGVLLLDDGVALTLDADYLLGRDPDRAPEVTSGEARPARVTSPDGSVSRRHLRVRLDGWDVNLLDLGSVNGTQVQPPGDPNFYDIPPNEPVPILPGTTVRIGVSRTMRYDSHRQA
ncbi:FHA domain-containing protein [Sphaerisporangium album]|uniref:FHA domain-containing protein n=1 Tax=Sphaerisporangium album TaxID=509200 RepID=A0A367FJ76_9ACTN|nr:FHA domain-containing protein [Sphaerisporangium album]RCG29757.1 FHA domain-containing protein [Sphaerisporangium album]